MAIKLTPKQEIMNRGRLAGAKEEREACAKLVYDFEGVTNSLKQRIAAAIRSRK